MADLATSVKHFSSLTRAPGPVWGAATKNRAPHKPILLLAVLDLVQRGVIDSPFIAVTAELVELNELFNLYWRRIVPLGQTSSIAFPFSRLDREPFWELVPQPGKSITQAVINNTSSVAYLRGYALGARMDEGLFRIMQTGEGREVLRETLLQSYFSKEAQALLREQSVVNRQAFDYSQALEDKALLPLVAEPPASDMYKRDARDQGFRRVVVTSYDHRCALCGVRIVTPEGHTVVDAAHIVPWSKSKNDDIRNGMALCKLCHWAFDEGMVGVSDRYDVLISRQIAVDPNVPGTLMTLAGRGIIGPKERERWPALQFIAEHRQMWRL
jgi:putative restriction endonuclease